MNYRMILNIIGKIVCVEAAFMLPALGISLYLGESSAALGFALSAAIMLAAALCAGNCYLLPLDTVPLITYAKGYYSMTDMAKSTAFLQIAMVILCALWLPLVGGMMGLG